MSSDLPAPLPQEQASEVVNRWAARGYFRLRNMGDKFFIREIIGGWAYTVRLQTHYEHRSVFQAREPYHGGRVDDHGRPPETWEIPVQRPGEFQERTESLTVPHTERVGICSRCGGDGRTLCTVCGSSGQTTCPMCGGTGMQQQQIPEMVRGPQGDPVSSVRVVERQCSCGDGRIRCPNCGGQGRVTCRDCRGSGQVKSFNRLIVKFLSSRNSDLFDVTPVPDGWFGRLTGESLVEERKRIIDSFPPINEEVDGRARKLIDHSHQIDESRTRILLQHLQIDRIPLHEVRYTYAGVDRCLWVCGKENEIYAPNAPWNRARFWGMIFLSSFVGAVVIGVLIYFLFFFAR